MRYICRYSHIDCKDTIFVKCRQMSPKRYVFNDNLFLRGVDNLFVKRIWQFQVDDLTLSLIKSNGAMYSVILVVQFHLSNYFFRL